MSHCLNCRHYITAHTDESPNSKCNACVDCGRGGDMLDQCDKIRDIYSASELKDQKCGKKNYTCKCKGWDSD